MKIKRIIPFLIFILTITFLCGNAYAEKSDTLKVIDNAGVLSETQASDLENVLETLSSENYIDFAVFFESTTPSEYYDRYGNDHVMYYCADLWDYGGYSDDGIALLITVDDREWTLVTEGQGDVYFSSYIQSNIKDAILPYLKDDDFAGAAAEFAAFLTDYMGNLGSSESDDYDYDIPYTEVSMADIVLSSFRANFVKLLVAALVLGLVVALIRIAVLKGELTSVRNETAAANYIVSGSMNLRAERDIFLYRDVTRIRKQKDEDNSHFVGSSGDSHTGSHGSF